MHPGGGYPLPSLLQSSSFLWQFQHLHTRPSIKLCVLSDIITDDKNFKRNTIYPDKLNVLYTKTFRLHRESFLDSDQSFLHRVGLSFPQLQQWERAHTHTLQSLQKHQSLLPCQKEERLFSESSPEIWEFDKAVKTLPVLKQLLLLKAWRPIFLLPTNCPCSHPHAIAEFGARICSTEADTPRRGGSCCWWFCCLNWERGLENMWLADAWASH